MSALFEELDYRPTPIGALSLRRRRELALGVDVIEIKLGEEFLMSSLFTESEVALAQQGLSAVEDAAMDVVVGGLGLGYTAAAVLDEPRVASLIVCEMLEPVIDWHQTGLLPLGPKLTADQRCRIVQGDFFAMSASQAGFDPRQPGRKFHAILADIDHSPHELLDQRSISFYEHEGLRQLASHLRPAGVFGLWSNAPPEEAFTNRLAEVFADAKAIPVTFRNPLQNNDFTQTVYVARAAAA
jgi:spermidine synthase